MTLTDIAYCLNRIFVYTRYQVLYNPEMVFHHLFTNIFLCLQFSLWMHFLLNMKRTMCELPERKWYQMIKVDRCVWFSSKKNKRKTEDRGQELKRAHIKKEHTAMKYSGKCLYQWPRLFFMFLIGCVVCKSETYTPVYLNYQIQFLTHSSCLWSLTFQVQDCKLLQK